MRKVILFKSCFLGSIILILVLSWVLMARARCDSDNNSTLINLYLRWLPPGLWPPEADGVIETALSRFDIDGEGEELIWRAEELLSDEPVITILGLEQDLPGKRIEPPRDCRRLGYVPPAWFASGYPGHQLKLRGSCIASTTS